jgi:fibronectin type 3 domain-containing protein
VSIRLNSRLLGLAAAALAVGVVSSCDDPTRPTTEASLSPNIALIQPDSMTRASLVLPLTGVRARTIGPTGRVLDLTLQGNTWRGTISGLAAGDYEVIIEGLAAGQVQFYGRLPSISLARGQRAQPTVPFAAAVSTVSPPPLNNTTNFSQRVPMSRVAAATGYVIQVSQDLAFGSGVTEFTAADTNPLVTVTQPGTWHLRTRALLPQIAASSVPWSEMRTWVVMQAAGGDAAGDAAPIVLVPEAPQTIAQRNLTPTKRNDWYDIDAEEGDSVFAETFAARLEFASGLNTRLTLFEDNGTTQVAQNDDLNGSTDSRLVYVAAESKTYKLRVDGMSNTSGHYELRTEIRRLPRAPESLVATIVSGTEVSLAWDDRSDNETSFRIERCEGAGCTTFTEIGSVAPDVEAFAVTGLTQGNTYRFRVRARNNVGNSAYTNVEATALVGPAAPTDLQATTLSSTQIDLQWTDNATNEVDYQVERCAGVDCTDFAVIATLPAGTEAYTDAAVVFNTAYRYRVRARNTVMPSAYSDEASANTIPPATPSTLAAAVTGPTSIALTWQDNSNNELGFRIERCLGEACTGFAVVANVGANVEAYVDNGVANNAAYRYRVRAFNAVDGVDATNVAEANTYPPAAPTGLTATTQSASSIALAWTDNATTETGYLIERCSSAPDCTDFASVTTIAAGSEAYTDGTVTVGNTYRYRVIAVGIAGNSAPSNIASSNTLLPAAPSALAAQTISAEVIRLTWTDNADNETGFRIFRCDTDGCSNFALLASIPSPAVTFDDSTAAAGTSYVYQVRAENVSGQSDASNSAAANTLPPSAPSDFTATVINATRVDLAWTNNDASATGTRIERCEGEGCTSFAEVAFAPSTDATYSDMSVTQGSVWRYRIRAQNAADVSGYTAVASTTTEVPGAVATLTYQILNGNQVQLDWSASAGPNLDQYVIRRCEGVGCTVTDVLNLVDASNTTYTDGSVTPGNTYRYVVSAIGVTGESTPSPLANVTIAVPEAPTGLGAVVRRGDVQLSWTTQPSTATVDIERCTGDACGAFAVIATVLAADNGYVDATVVANETYAYRVRAENAIGFSAYSSVSLAFTTLTPAPSGLTATVVSGTRVDLEWTDNALTETGFAIERCTGDACVDYAVIDTVAPNVLAFSDLTVEAGNAYGYRLRSLAPFGASTPSNAVAITTRIPEAPTDLVAQTLSNSSIRLTWTDNSDNETQFNIARCAGVDCTVPAEAFVSLPAGTIEYNDTGLDPNETYTYHVFATNTVGSSAPTNAATATTNLPAVPTGLAGSVVDATTIAVSWTDVAAELGYRLERCEGVGCSGFAEVAETGEDVVEFVDGGRTAGVLYRYRLRAFNAAGSSDYTTVLSITAGNPATPTDVVATTLSGTSIQITWTDNSDNESSFTVTRCTGVDCVGFTTGFGVSANATEFTDNSVTPGNAYRYRVFANNDAGASSFSDYAAASTIAPDAPSDLVATTFSASQINLTWTDNGPYETGFQIERCVGVSCSDFTLLTTTAADATDYSDTGLAQNESYSYRVRAVNAVANSAYTGVATATTDLPAAPTDLAALPLSANEVELSWVDVANNEENYLVERCQGTDCADFGFLALLGVDVETYSDATVDADGTYRYRVRAIGSAGPSPNSNVAEAITSVPGDPSDLVATTVNAGRIDLAWTDNGVNELNYRVERCLGPGCSDFTEHTVLPAGTTSYSDETVAVDLAYRYRVRASNNVGASGYSNEAGANTLRPASPSTLGGAGRVGHAGGPGVDGQRRQRARLHHRALHGCRLHGLRGHRYDRRERHGLRGPDGGGGARLPLSRLRVQRQRPLGRHRAGGCQHARAGRPE